MSYNSGTDDSSSNKHYSAELDHKTQLWFILDKRCSKTTYRLSLHFPVDLDVELQCKWANFVANSLDAQVM